MSRIKYTKEILLPYVQESKSFKDLIDKLGLVYCNGSVGNISKALKRNNINYEHLKDKDFISTKKRTDEEIFSSSSNVDRQILKRKIIKNNLIEYKCSSCGCNDQWLGQKMPLILDHINGINNDNRLENLRFLCSNCDSIQPTYKNRKPQRSD